jgi:acyl dehydratase
MTFDFANADRFVGQELGLSDWLTIDQQRINKFAEATLDRQWIHVDEERAAAGPFGATIAHGYLTLSLLSATHFGLGILPAGADTVINYGLDRVRFLTPVLAGSRVRNRVTLLDAQYRSDTRLLIKLDNRVEIEGSADPALVAETLLLLVNDTRENSGA